MKNLAVRLISYYQKTISPDHGSLGRLWGSNRCKFFPSCSEYTLISIRQYGLISGCMLSLRRILRCNPWSRGGFDPVG